MYIADYYVKTSRKMTEEDMMSTDAEEVNPLSYQLRIAATTMSSHSTTRKYFLLKRIIVHFQLNWLNNLYYMNKCLKICTFKFMHCFLTKLKIIQQTKF